jgi:hypothetical protein
VYQSKTNLSADQYNYINSTLSLKQAAGSLAGTDVVAINHWLGENTTAQPIPKVKKHKKHKKFKKHIQKN